ncbi:hypothetical protein DH2020_042485 [Rehmannia glutinosa]|uniref:Uncharacterized protein n=1 Tax=Rehmannia glutinosa TaxID=99300 RepID=A0ABR0UNR2_REHGL
MTATELRHRRLRRVHTRRLSLRRLRPELLCMRLPPQLPPESHLQPISPRRRGDHGRRGTREASAGDGNGVLSAEQQEKVQNEIHGGTEGENAGICGEVGLRLQRKDEEDEIERFCRGVGISRKVFKVWMHNHKNSPTSHSANASSLTDDH